MFNIDFIRFLYTIRTGVSGLKIASSGAAIFRQIAKDGNLANAGAAEGGPMEGADRRGESCQSQTEKSRKISGFFLFNNKLLSLLNTIRNGVSGS